MAIVDFFNANAFVTIEGIPYPVPWANQTNWGTAARLSTWYGVTVDVNGRVTGLNLNDNRLIWHNFPASFANLSKLTDLQLRDHSETGQIPDVLAALQN